MNARDRKVAQVDAATAHWGESAQTGSAISPSTSLGPAPFLQAPPPHLLRHRRLADRLARDRVRDGHDDGRVTDLAGGRQSTPVFRFRAISMTTAPDSPDDSAAAPAASVAEAADATSAEVRRPELPDRLSVDPRSRHHVATVFEHEIGIRLNGRDQFGVEEYCISEGWIAVPHAKALDRRGRPLMVKLKGRVEAFYR